MRFVYRLRGLILYLWDYKIILFSLLYVLLNVLVTKLLRNIPLDLSMGYVLWVVVLFFVILLPFVPLRNKWKQNVARRESIGVLSFAVYLLGTALVVVVPTCLVLARVSPLMTKERVALDSAPRFTDSLAVFEGYVVDEPLSKSKLDQLRVAPLQDMSSIGGGTYPYDSKLLVKVPNYIDVKVGQVCNFVGVVEEPENFDDFDYKTYLMNQGIFLIMQDPVVRCFDVEDRRGGGLIRNSLLDWKDKVVQKVDEILHEPQSSLLVGILFGQQRLFSKEFDSNIRMSGLSHIVAASGYNITILVVAINGIFAFLGKKLRVSAGIAVVWCFAIIAGFSSSIVRACIMSTLSLIAILLGRGNAIHISIVLTAAIFVFLDPYIVFDVGFILSISATIGLVYIMPILQKLRIKYMERFSFLDDTVLPTISCTLSTLPISLYTFNTFTIWSVPANALVLPVVEGTMLWGLLSLLTLDIHKGLALFFMTIVNVQLKFMEYVVNLVGSIGWGYWELDPIKSKILASIMLLGLFLFVIYMYPIENEKYNHYLKRNS